MQNVIEYLRRLDESIVGDILGAVSLFILGIGLFVFLPLFVG